MGAICFTRRGAGVPPVGAGHPAAAPGAGVGDHPSGGRVGDVPLPGPAGAGRQPLPVRQRRRRHRLHLQPPGAAALPVPAVRPAARPDRPTGRPARGHPRGLAGRPRAAGVHGRGRPPGAGGTSRRGAPAGGHRVVRRTARCRGGCSASAGRYPGRRCGSPSGHWSVVRCRSAASTASSASPGRWPIWRGGRRPAPTRWPRRWACGCSGPRHERSTDLARGRLRPGGRPESGGRAPG